VCQLIEGGMSGVGMVVSVLLCMRESVHYRQCCGSGMIIPGPDFFFHPPVFRSKKYEGMKKKSYFTALAFFFVVINFTEL
jgi:hypothetical protein